jgi:DNA invertase Pin-like site-specific DNA recombinase
MARRDERSRLLRNVTNGKLDKVLVYDFGRLASSRIEVFELFMKLLESPVELIIPSVGTITN